MAHELSRKDGCTSAHAGLSALSRELFTSYGLGYDELFELLGAPADHPDLFLFDPMVGFVLTPAAEKKNFWLGNQKDIAEALKLSAPQRNLLFQSSSDHFSIGKSLLLRVVAPHLQRTYKLELDGADIPVFRVDSQRGLDALADDLLQACDRSPLPISLFFRGQTSGHRLPDRSHLVKSGIALYSDVRDYSLVPSMYRQYDRFLDNPSEFRAFVSMLQDWSFCSDMLFGDPATYTTMDGQPYVPKPVAADSTSSMSMHMSGASAGGVRAFDDMGPYTVWTITDQSGAIVDTYVKRHRPGHDSIRRNLILQHYGAPTSFIDVTRDVRVAEWFAWNRITIGADGLSNSGLLASPQREAGIFVLLVLEGFAPVVDTAQLISEEEALRPHRQACAVLGGAGNLYRNAVSRFIAARIVFSDSFVPANLPTARHLFPGPDEDDALKRLLEQHANRYSLPDKLPVEFPVYWFPDSKVVAATSFSVPKPQSARGQSVPSGVKTSLRNIVATVEQLLQARQPLAALEIADSVLQQAPDEPALLNVKGIALGQLRRDIDALECFERCTQLAPNVAQAWYHRAVALIDLKRHAEAVVSLQRARSIDPTEPSAAYNLGIEICRAGGSTAEALTHLNDAAKLGHPSAAEAISRVQAGHTV